MSANDIRHGRRGGREAVPIPGASCPTCRRADVAWMAVRRDLATGTAVEAWPVCDGCRKRCRARDDQPRQASPGMEFWPLPARWPGASGSVAT